MTRSCGACTVSFEGRADAKWCSEKCRKRAARVAANPPTEPAEASAVVAATRKALVAAGRVDTMLGAACLALAARIDLNNDTASALAAAVKQLEATFANATKGVAVQVSTVDELRARRDTKRGA